MRTLLVLAPAPIALTVAQAVGPDSQSWFDLVQYGILGLVVLGLLTGKIVPGWVHKQDQSDLTEAIADGKELRGEIRELNLLFKEQVIPALVRTTDTLARATDVLARVTEQRQGHNEQGDRR